LRPILPLLALLAACSTKPPIAELSTQVAIERTTAADWRRLDPADTLYMDVNGGTVVIELAPHFSRAHVDNIRTLVREGFFDGTSVNRVQENYVVQWGDATEKKPLGAAQATLPLGAEVDAKGLDFAALPYRDAYAPEVGFVHGFPAARDRKADKAWAAHCYGAVGVGRGESPDSGSGAELYTVIGHAPRHLDRNYAVVGRIVQGMELLTTLPRGTGQLGFYERAEERVPIKRVRLGADVPEAERLNVEIMRTDTPAFAAYADARANRARDGFLVSMGGVDVCNIRVPMRPVEAR
jgi:peptidylprolyl isomerase